ncbi:hypothetical protein CRG98_040350 [Punica granatum]|uniref:ADP-ribosyl cyclase/cyclic ADP-ribose hydrolase n=1 Tax=Punica granatum TaxID=22663 RepID=A0A2I0I5L9_PUNGR|nr:hypothetical protein CRG98_040350 [Punica granatum]
MASPDAGGRCEMLELVVCIALLIVLLKFLLSNGTRHPREFTDCQHNSSAGILVFQDSEDLHSGDEIVPKFKPGDHAVEDLHSHILQYASSKWCLREHSLIAKRYREKKQIVVPIFLDVTPDEFKNQTWNYNAELRQHARKYLRCVGEWRSALSELGRLKGSHITHITLHYIHIFI